MKNDKQKECVENTTNGVGGINRMIYVEQALHMSGNG